MPYFRHHALMVGGETCAWAAACVGVSQGRLGWGGDFAGLGRLRVPAITGTSLVEVSRFPLRGFWPCATLLMRSVPRNGMASLHCLRVTFARHPRSFVPHVATGWQGQSVLWFPWCNRFLWFFVRAFACTFVRLYFWPIALTLPLACRGPRASSQGFHHLAVVEVLNVSVSGAQPLVAQGS